MMKQMQAHRYLEGSAEKDGKKRTQPTTQTAAPEKSAMFNKQLRANSAKLLNFCGEEGSSAIEAEGLDMDEG